MLRPLVALALLLVGCSQGGPAGDGKPLVVTTVSPITNIVANIAGEQARVVGIVPEGTNSHTFEPAPSDARLLAGADLMFMNGLHLEEPIRELAEAALPEGVEIVKLAECTIEPSEHIYDFSFPRAGGDPNPHLWTHPLYAKEFARIVLEELATLVPAASETFKRNYEAFAARIDALDRAVKEATATVPAKNRKLLTYHDSFPYFARHYGWEVVGAIQPSDFSEPTPRDVQRLIQQIRREQVPAIFGSEVFPSPVLERIAAATGARYVDDLRDDDLPGEPGDPEHTYLGLMVFDFKTIVRALGGDPSPFDAVDTSNVAEADVEYRG